jgi:hypothetical protein
MGIPIGIYKNGKLVRITELRKRDIKEDCERMVDLTHRPDIKVGHVWGTEPDGYGVMYKIENGKIVPITPDAAAIPAPVVAPATPAPIVLTAPRAPFVLAPSPAPAPAPVPSVDPAVTT